MKIGKTFNRILNRTHSSATRYRVVSGGMGWSYEGEESPMREYHVVSGPWKGRNRRYAGGKALDLFLNRECEGSPRNADADEAREALKAFLVEKGYGAWVARRFP